ncbi:reverse transcriptase domain-containing protein [Tanacetum coccineum]
MKLNPKKCSFNVEEGPFLGHLITKQGIKANPSKVKAVTDLDQPRTLKDIQSLNGKLAALNQFLSKGVKRALAFFKVLKGCKDKKSIQWTTEADKVLEKMKKLVQALPTLTVPMVGETLTINLTASKESISVVLATKRNEGWTPIYFVSRVLQGAELNYPALEKLILALVYAARRLRRYFQAHTITVLTNTPIKQMLTEPEKTGRIPFEDNEKKEKPKEVLDSNSKWRLYTNGASNSDELGARLMLIDPEGNEYTYALRFEFETTNNEAEYEALIAGLQIDHEMEISKVAIFMDSQLLVNQIKETFAAKQTSIKDYLQKVKTALRGFEEYTVEHVRKNQNKKADALSNLASMTFEHLTKEVLVEVLTKMSIEEKEVLKVDMQERKSWMDPIYEYLLCRLLLEDTKEARKIIIQVPQYKLIRGNLKAGTSGAIAARSTWPFSYWRIHILGPLPMAPRGLQFLAIAFEHSTKWVEAEPLTTINERQVEKFVWEYVVCRFRVPQIISSKEEKYFKEGMFADLCKGLKVTQSFSPVTEHIEIMHHIERQLTRSQQGWVDNLAKTLWIHRTLPRNSQKETPFSLTYGSEAMIPIIETTYDRGRVQKATKGKESKEVASIEKAYYQNKLQNTTTQGAITPYGEGFIRSAGGDIGFKDGAKDGVAFWEEASIRAAASATNSSSQGNIALACEKNYKYSSVGGTMARKPLKLILKKTNYTPPINVAAATNEKIVLTGMNEKNAADGHNDVILKGMTVNDILIQCESSILRLKE